MQAATHHSNRKRSSYRGHHLLVEGERDVGTVVLVIGVRHAFGLHRLQAGGVTLAHICAGADETLVVQDGDAALPAGALAVPFVDQAGARATPDLERKTGGGTSGEMPVSCSRTQGARGRTRGRSSPRAYL